MSHSLQRIGPNSGTLARATVALAKDTMILYQLWLPILLLGNCLLPDLVQGVLHVRKGKMEIQALAPPAAPRAFDSWLKANGLAFSYGNIDFSLAQPAEIRCFPEKFYREYASAPQLKQIRSILVGSEEVDSDSQLCTIREIVLFRTQPVESPKSLGKESHRTTSNSSTYSYCGALYPKSAALPVPCFNTSLEKSSSSSYLRSSCPERPLKKSLPINIRNSSQDILQYDVDEKCENNTNDEDDKRVPDSLQETIVLDTVEEDSHDGQDDEGMWPFDLAD